MLVLKHAHRVEEGVVLVEGHSDNVLVSEADVLIRVEVAEGAVAAELEEPGKQWNSRKSGKISRVRRFSVLDAGVPGEVNVALEKVVLQVHPHLRFPFLAHDLVSCSNRG